MLLDLHPGEQRVEVRLDDLVEQDEARRLDLEQARQDLRDLDPGEPALAGLRIAQPDRDRQAERRDVRERVSRIDGERRQHREDLVEEALAERLVVLGDRRVVEQFDPLGGQRPPDRDVDRRVVGDELEDARAGGRELLLGGPPVGRAGDLAGLDLLAQAGDADLEELVEVAGEDGQELHPLEQRIALVARLVQDAGVELEPRQLAVEVRVGRLRRGSCDGGVAEPRVGRVRLGRSRPSEGLVGPLCLGRGRVSDPAGEDSTRPIVTPRPRTAVRRCAGSTQTRIVRLDVGSMKTSSLRRKRGSMLRRRSARRHPGRSARRSGRSPRSDSGRARSSVPIMNAMPIPTSQSPVIESAGPSTRDEDEAARAIVRPSARTRSRATPKPPAHSTGVVGARRSVGGDHDGRPVGDDLAHRARQLGAVEAHRQDRVGAEQRGVLDQPVERLAAGVLEQAGVFVDLAAAERAEAGHQVAAQPAAADDEAEDHPLALGDAVAGEIGVVTTIMRAPRGGPRPTAAVAALAVGRCSPGRAPVAQHRERVVAGVVAVGPGGAMA